MRTVGASTKAGLKAGGEVLGHRRDGWPIFRAPSVAKAKALKAAGFEHTTWPARLNCDPFASLRGWSEPQDD